MRDLARPNDEVVRMRYLVVLSLTAIGFVKFPSNEPIAPVNAKEEVWWSLRPLSRPAVPLVEGVEARNPIDSFVGATLKQKGLTPSPEADRRTLIRRLSFDLLGMPPTLDEIAAFVEDARPDAYGRLVDRMLASPHHGERWARHWMDAVHFAETHGHDQDRIRPNAWPYRDYLIESFNADKPYARFVEEQVAADALYPEATGAVRGLGLLSAGPWDESSLRDIREDTIDREIGHYLDRDDMVSTVLSSFCSVTIHCARCHDHKFDPISQSDYYSLQAVFAGVGRAERAFDADSATHRKRQELASKLNALQRRDAAVLDLIQGEEFQAEVRAWEAKQAGAAPVAWTVLEPSKATSRDGATLTRMPDHSIRSEGKRPERDVYTVTAVADLRGITAVRLEVMTDDALPHKGPGRQDNGNLHLSEFRVQAAPKATPLLSRPVPIATATADFDQNGWTVRHAIDGQPATAWGIYPEVGKAHVAIFELKEDVGHEGGTELTFVLEQLHGGGHLIGRPRLSVTSAQRPVRLSKLPDAVARALATPAVKRGKEEKLTVAIHYLQNKLESELARLPVPQMVYAVASDFKADGGHKPPLKPRAVHVLKRGDIRKPGDAAAPGTLHCVSAMPARFELKNPEDEGARRAALARWITSKDNPLTWRSIVNRVWHYHFGRGLVDTPNDLGKMGSKPMHPELLDWLAVEFRDGGQSLKQLHRLIVTSATYRQSSAHHAGNARVDADNRYLWRMNRTRLDAESVRDAVLLVSERLDRTSGGPSDQQFGLKPGIHVTPLVDYGTFNWDRERGHRRSVYRFVFRTLPDPFVDCLDGADGAQLTPVRNTSSSALQALALLNNEFILVHSRALAASLEKATSDREKQLTVACERVWGRAPTKQELGEMREYVERHGLANLCRLLLNSNEFLFVN